jgi:GNAT superfamily N-acetyltransferase
MTRSVKLSISEPDTRRFGIPYVRAQDLTFADLAATLDYCRGHDAGVCVARCGTGDFVTIHALEDEGFRLMDTLVYYQARLDDTPIPERRLALPIRSARAEESGAVGQLAAAAFKDYFSHYHADPRFDRRKVDEVFIDWASRSCLDKGVADEVFVADAGSDLGAFATMRFNDECEGEGVLFAVHPKQQGKGIYRDLMISGMRWCKDHGRGRMVVSTQVNNYTVQRAWIRLGFAIYKSFDTFHKWFS